MNDGTTNVIDPSSNPQQDSVNTAEPFAGGETPRTFSRQDLTGNSRGIQQFGTPNLFVDSGNNYFGVSKNNVQQVLMGLQPTFGEGFYVSKDGVDVSTTTNAGDLIFNSNQNVFKVVKTDIVNMNLGSSTITTLSFPHGLNFAPIPLAYLINVTLGGAISNANLPLPTFLNADIGSTTAGVVSFGSYLYCAADTQKVHFQFLNATGVAPGVFQIRYYLLQESSGRV